MYFRIIVKQAGAFAFRTSKIATVAALITTLRGVERGFPSNEGFTAEVLQCKPSEGAVLSFAEIAALEAGAAVVEQPEAVGISDPMLAEHPIAKANAASWPTGA